MPFTSRGVTPDILLNPHAIPSRMTIAQLIETLVGKKVSLDGTEADGTPFNQIDPEAIKDALEKLGYERNGYEYLYNGMTGEKLKVMICIGPTYYQRLKHQVEDKIHCLTMDHEVLTHNGWKYYNQLSMDDLIATLDNGELKYVKPLKLLHFKNYQGKLYNIESQQISLQVTDNHRMWVSKSKGDAEFKDFELIEAKNIMGKHVRYQKDTLWTKQDYQFVLPGIKCINGIEYMDKKVDMTAWLTFFGIWMTEGWTTSKDKRCKNSQSYKIQIYQCKERVRKVIYNALQKLGYNYNIQTDKITIHDKQLYNYMVNLNGASNKKLPDWVWNLSTNQSKILLESMILNDDSYCKSTSKYYTVSKHLADDIMKLCLHAGWSGNISQIEGKDVKSNCDMIRIEINKNNNKPSVNRSHNQNIQKEELIEYRGEVFCLQVPSEIFYVRKNGKGVWTGNSRSRGPKTLLTHQAPEGRLTLVLVN